MDFSCIIYIYSTGIGELVGYLGGFRDFQRALILVNPNDRIRKLLQVARLAELFPTYDTVAAAMDGER
jgi:anti-anti-sigma factor